MNMRLSISSDKWSIDVCGPWHWIPKRTQFITNPLHSWRCFGFLKIFYWGEER